MTFARFVQVLVLAISAMCASTNVLSAESSPPEPIWTLKVPKNCAPKDVFSGLGTTVKETITSRQRMARHRIWLMEDELNSSHSGLAVFLADRLSLKVNGTITDNESLDVTDDGETLKLTDTSGFDATLTFSLPLNFLKKRKEDSYTKIIQITNAQDLLRASARKFTNDVFSKYSLFKSNFNRFCQNRVCEIEDGTSLAPLLESAIDFFGQFDSGTGQAGSTSVASEERCKTLYSSGEDQTACAERLEFLDEFEKTRQMDGNESNSGSSLAACRVHWLNQEIVTRELEPNDSEGS